MSPLGIDGPRYASSPDANTLSALGRLRILAWEADGERPSFAPKNGDSWLDAHDEHAHHWIFEREGSIVAAARMCVHSELASMPDVEFLVGIEQEELSFPAASLNRLVVHPNERGHGLASAFDKLRIDFASTLGAKSVMVVTHVESRLRDLHAAGFAVLCESPHKTVSYANSFVLVRSLENHSDSSS